MISSRLTQLCVRPVLRSSFICHVTARPLRLCDEQKAQLFIHRPTDHSYGSFFRSFVTWQAAQAVWWAVRPFSFIWIVHVSRDSYLVTVVLLNNNGREDTGYSHFIVVCICFPTFSYGFNCLWHFVYYALSAEANHVAFSVKCLRTAVFFTMPTRGLQRHQL